MADEVDVNKQAEAANEANADYQVQGPLATAPPPQLPDLAVLREQQSVQQGGERPLPQSMYEDVAIADDGSRSSAPVDDEGGAQQQSATQQQPTRQTTRGKS